MTQTSSPASTADTKANTDTLNRFIGYRMKRAYMVVLDDLMKTLDRMGLRVTTFSALSVIVENPDITQTQLAHALRVERSGVVVIIDDLELSGLVTRGRVDGDRRAYALRATPKGEAKQKEASEAVSAHEDRVFSKLTPQDRTTLSTLLTTIERTGSLET
ncbi:MarR family winged helix-turn-helix transcriptional regulator [Celeribacter arenosi]|uniref:HTH marR-type domain-containing protein n=1 Tax=Celeribacter arenosi TaxID=792649 RepID=A0ABP7K4C7_9RHOB